jgi:glyoxalase family protein
METKVKGLHHITAIASDAQRNYNFYTQVLGLRFLKRTVNFDDPGTYHFYYGDETGSPGNVLTFFPWNGVARGKTGTGMATEIGYSVPENSLSFWKDRLSQFNVEHKEIDRIFGEEFLEFIDPDGLILKLIISNDKDERKPWSKGGVDENFAIKGFHNIVLNEKGIKKTADILIGIFGYSETGNEGNRYRFSTNASDTANIIDIIESPEEPHGRVAGGSIHHVAFRVKNEEALEEIREKIASKGFNITPKINRNYFFSIYFREPGGVLFEVATDNPGFLIDETVDELGSSLKLPPQHKSKRKEIEQLLPKVDF